MARSRLTALLCAPLIAARAVAPRCDTADGQCPAAEETTEETVLLQRPLGVHEFVDLASQVTPGEAKPAHPIRQGVPRKPRHMLAGKSVYFLPVDRFARPSGSPLEACDKDNHWCGGTLRGAIEHLDYIQGMAFDCIWITPVVYQYQGETPSGTGCMGYWAYDLYKIDPHFGTEEDLKDLVKGLHSRGMCLMYDFVANHMGPIHSTADANNIIPFGKPEYYHQLFRGDMTFDEYVAKSSDWPPPAQAMWSQSGAQCTQGRDCSCYKCVVDGDLGIVGSDPFGDCQGQMLYNSESPCPENALSPYCMPGDYQCEGYNETITQEGWFYDLGDLNQTDPFVRKKQLEWIRWFVDKYDIDLLRLDTAAFMTFDFLSELQEAAKVPIIGEVTTTNLTYHARFQKDSEANNRRTLAGVLNFPLYYSALAGFCGKWFPYSTFNLTFLGQRMEEQLAAPYRSVDALGNFIDNHDVDRVASVCNSDVSRIYNSLVWTMFAKGVPIIYYGTEELFTSVRASLWDKGYNTTTTTYKLLRNLNLIRQEHHVALADIKVLPTDSDSTLVFTRGWKVVVFLNNLEEGQRPVTYCVDFPKSHGCKWVDAISGEEASIDDGCYTAADTYPKVLVRKPHAGEHEE